MRKKYLILSNTMKKGGAERVISLMLNKIVNTSYVEIDLLLMESGIEYEIPNNVKLTILSKSQKNNFQKFIELPFVSWQISKYIKDNNIDTVISFLYRPNYVNILSKLFGARHKAIINIRSTTSRYRTEGLLGRINLFLIKNLFNKADLIISNSYGVDEDLKKLMKITTNTKIIYNPVDIEYINSKKYKCEDIPFRFEQGKKYIISVGRLIPLKRNNDLIDAFFEIQKNDEMVELLFLGDGILKNKLMDRCSELGIINKIHFLGNVKNPFYYLLRSSIFVLTSEVEGFPNVLLEAMACGLPIISSDCNSGPREILGNEIHGLLYPVGDIKILIHKIKYYLYIDYPKDKLLLSNFSRLESFKIDRVINEFKDALGFD